MSYIHAIFKCYCFSNTFEIYFKISWKAFFLIVAISAILSRLLPPFMLAQMLALAKNEKKL